MNKTKTHTIHIGSSKILFTGAVPACGCAVVTVDDTLSVSRAKIVKKVETDKFIVVLTPAPTETFNLFSQQFVCVEAAGGVVRNSAGDLLMIRLRGRWDLPKGHVEAGETSCVAALREVAEETGVVAEIVGSEPLAYTWHAYDTYGRWELKRTAWWEMRTTTRADLLPQREEGITEVVWCGAEQLAENMKNTYETIKEVVAALECRVACGDATFATTKER